MIECFFYVLSRCFCKIHVASNESGNESWLTPDIKNSEIFPDSFDAVRKDRASDAHGGVFIAFKCNLLCTETPELDTNCEIVWCKLNIIGCRTLYLGSFYRPPP